VSDSGRSDLEATKQWRLNWWRTIVDYTIDGPYFWMGKGYGINLADSDGFQVGTRDEPLRSPHSSHVTLLARSGVPGFILWLALQLTWAGLMLKSYFTAKKLYAAAWVGVFAWLLTYWLAFMVAAGFDVFLEGPMAGIPFWTIFGLGWGSHTLFRNQLERLCVREAEQVIQHVGRAQYAVV
jgi:O-antigen ligase